MTEAASARARERVEQLHRYLEQRYGIAVAGVTRLGRGVLRVDRHEGPSWVARVFPGERPIERVRGDAEVLRFLEDQRFPAERLAHADPVSAAGGWGILVTEYLEGTTPEPALHVLRSLGEMLGRLATMPAPPGIGQDAGALHHYALAGGGARSELDAAASWLDALAHAVPESWRFTHRALRERLERSDDSRDLPHALIHPDPVIKNLIATPDGGLVLIDWTGASQGPRLVSLAAAIYAAALTDAGWSPESVDAIVAGYRPHVQLEPPELARLAGVMRVRPLVFACWRYRHTFRSGKVPTGREWWWPSDELTDVIAARARAGFACD